MGGMKDSLGDTFFESRQAELFPAKFRRDVALKQVEGNAGDWFSLAMSVVLGLPVGFEGTGEDIRLTVEERIGKPHHHNVWGALTAQLVKQRVLHEIGRVHMKTEKSHARRTPLYKKVR